MRGINKALRIYIAGPYTAQKKLEIRRNVNRAIDAGIEVFLKGHIPYVPHLTHHVDKRARETGIGLSWSDYIRWDMPWLEICDALLYIGKSRGAHIELERARKLGKKVFFSLEEVPDVKMRRPATLTAFAKRK